MNRIGIMHLIDTLDAGGAERVAVNLANLLPREKYRIHLCTTRREGVLADLVEKDVGRICLDRSGRFDWQALRRLSSYIRTHRIQLLHAHSTALFVAVLAGFCRPFPKVIWHDHYGAYASKERPVLPYWLLTRRVSGVIAVNLPLAKWAKDRLRIPDKRIFYVPNFAVITPDSDGSGPDIPGTKGSRIVCVANFRPQKDHITLLRAMAIVVRHFHEASLLLIGASNDNKHDTLIRKELLNLGIEKNVFVLGQRNDVESFIRGSDIGVLSSASEGFPLALIEYGLGGLPVVATSVGQCPEIMDEGRAGILVPPGSPDKLAGALLSLLSNGERAKEMGLKFNRRVQELYSPKSIIKTIREIYENTLFSGERMSN